VVVKGFEERGKVGRAGRRGKGQGNSCENASPFCFLRGGAVATAHEKSARGDWGHECGTMDVKEGKWILEANKEHSHPKARFAGSKKKGHTLCRVEA